ncbi:MAG: glycoside hydrolase family 3 C-terminal domain-containing protein [Anaerolineae bacterium]|nr:glycoside hydrolase family 3 C-terminal domain-containing protein [Anaerolineae bacterium]
MPLQLSDSFREPSADVVDQVENLLGQMTLAEKIGQMTQVEKNSIEPAQVAEYAIGSVLSGGGGNPVPNTPQNWAAMVRKFAEAALKSRLAIPLIYGVDGVHGHNNVHGAVIYPHNIGLGATRDADLLERIGRATARELLATGVQWNFAPAVSVPQDIRWGRIYEGYSEQTALVTQLALAYLQGLHAPGLGDSWVLPSVKHFVGDGGALWGSTQLRPWQAESSANWQGATDLYKIDQGDTRLDEATLRALHLAPYVEAIKAGALNIMISHSSWNGIKMHMHRYLLTDVLKGELGFAGFLISDWMAINQLDEDYYTCVVSSINAGLDMIMVPFDFKLFITTLTEAVHNGDVAQERIDDAVRRILRVKASLGLFEQPLIEPIHLDLVGSEEHRALAREAVQKSLVLLKNERDTLPITQNTASIFVAGEAADDIGLACGGWSIEWLGNSGAITDGGTLVKGLQAAFEGKVTYEADATFNGHAELGIVVLGERPYAEGLGDRADLTLFAEQVALIKRTREHCDRLILILYSGRPLIIGEVLDQCDAVVAAWLPGTEAHAIAAVLAGEVPFTGKLAHNWPRSMAQVPLAALKASNEPPLYPFGHGLEA